MADSNQLMIGSDVGRTKRDAGAAAHGAVFQPVLEVVDGCQRVRIDPCPQGRPSVAHVSYREVLDRRRSRWGGRYQLEDLHLRDSVIRPVGHKYSGVISRDGDPMRFRECAFGSPLAKGRDELTTVVIDLDTGVREGFGNIDIVSGRVDCDTEAGRRIYRFRSRGIAGRSSHREWGRGAELQDVPAPTIHVDRPS